MGTTCRHLRRLCLSKCRQVTDGALDALAAGPCARRALRVLEMVGTGALAFNAVVDLLEACRHLQLLDLRSCRFKYAPTPPAAGGKRAFTFAGTQNTHGGDHDDEEEEGDGESKAAGGSARQWRGIRDDREGHHTLRCIFPHVQFLLKW